MDSVDSTVAVNVHVLDGGRTWSYYDLNRSNFQKIFGNLIKNERGLVGRVIDIGCGHGDNPAYQFFGEAIGQLDGVDPFPMVEPAPNLANRWTCSLEDLPIEDNTYDLAYSFNVVEHVIEIDPFLKKAVALLKPGACYWSLSPNYYHPFAKITRGVQSLGLINLYRKTINGQANQYPAFYRLSWQENVLDSIIRQNLPVKKIDFYYVPNVQWDRYFPRILRFLPHIADKFWILRRTKRSFIFMFRIEKLANPNERRS